MCCQSGLRIILLVGVIFDPSAALTAIAPFGTHLISNSDAESDVDASTGETIGPVAGFTTSQGDRAVFAARFLSGANGELTNAPSDQ